MKIWEEKTVQVLISRAYIGSIRCKQNFGPMHQKVGKPKRDPAVRGCTTPSVAPTFALAAFVLPTLHQDMVHAWVAQKTLKHDILRVFTVSDLFNI